MKKPGEGKKASPLLVLKFSSAYDRQSFWLDIPHVLLDMGDIRGSNCYCDGEARNEILKRMKEAPGGKIRLLDSGNYHYLSGLWMEQCTEPFTLLVFDQHTDMQPPSFGGLLSCGGWILSALEENPHLQDVILAGPKKEDFNATDPSLRGRIYFFSGEELSKDLQGFIGFLKDLPSKRPLYLSLDKDILCMEDAATDWDQGQMRAEELLIILEALFASMEEKGMKLLAFDICGDKREGTPMEDERNEELNRRLLALCERHEGLFC